MKMENDFFLEPPNPALFISLCPAPSPVLCQLVEKRLMFPESPSMWGRRGPRSEVMFTVPVWSCHCVKWSQRLITHSFGWELEGLPDISNSWHILILKKIFVAYLKFKLKWVACILSGNPIWWGSWKGWSLLENSQSVKGLWRNMGNLGGGLYY